ncbi:MAG TPA: hypothetical protein VGB79_06820 [Allosphingosinicella sp.]
MSGAPAPAAATLVTGTPDTAAPGGPFSTRTIVALVATGIAGFLLFLLLTAYAGHLRGGGGDPRAHALSKTAVGFHGLVRLVELSGGRSRMVRSEEEHHTRDLLVVMVEASTEPARLAELLQRRQSLPTLVILPKWQVRRDPARPGRVLSGGTLPGFVAGRALGNEDRIRIEGGAGGGARLFGSSYFEGIAAPAPHALQVATGRTLTPLLSAGSGAVVAQFGEAPHYLLADPDLMNNHGLANPERALAAIQMLGLMSGEETQHVAFDLTLNGIGTGRSPLRLVFEPPFLPLTIALFLAALLAGLHGAFRFGAPAESSRALAFGKSQLVENSAGLFKLARREHRAGAAYAELVRETAARESGAHLALRDAELDAYLDRVSPEGRPRFSELADRARNAADPSQLLAAARALFQWKKDLIK